MRRLWLTFSQAVTVAVALLFVVATLKPDWLPRSGSSGRPDIVSITQAIAPAATGASGVAGTWTYASAAAAAAPAVVSIAVSRPGGRNPHANEPWFRHFFGNGEGRAPTVLGQGSGVIVSEQGYVLTNHHVIAGATDIEIGLLDGRRAPARVVGTDPETDLAVLKVDLDRLPAIVLAASDTSRVGDIVLAIGNPFGLDHTVTSGIVSALNRTGLSDSAFSNFMQTDAAINPGNSGGALVDVQGRLVGINTAIVASERGGNQGIGFAIPVGLARDVMSALIEEGEVSRGWIGAEPRDLTPELAQTLGLRGTDGALLAGVLQSGPAGSSGLRPGDVVTRVGDQTILDARGLRAAVAGIRPGTDAEFAVWRRDRAVVVAVKVGKRPPPGAVRPSRAMPQE
jgi:serine protease DegQ